MKHLLALALFVLASCGTVEKQCTLIGCSNGTTIRLNFPSGRAPAAGNYVVTTAAGNFSFTVASNGTASMPESCFPGGVDGTGLTCFLMGTATPPPSVSVIITRDGTQIVQTSATSSVTESYPNGKECGGACSQGTASVDLP
jgi:hypothetical protein